jgi:hypothetical protein
MDESLADLCELDWFKQSSSSAAALVRSFQIGSDFGERSEWDERHRRSEPDWRSCEGSSE